MTDDFRDDRSEARPDPEQPETGDPARLETGDSAGGRRRAERRRRVQARSFDTTVASPCIAVCQLDADDVCIGCQRTMDEIRDWPILSAEEKRAVLANVEARKADT